MTGSNPTDRGKPGTKRHILTDKKGIPLSVVVSSASSHDIKLVTDVVDNTVIRRPESSLISASTHKTRRRLQHLCLDKACNSAQEEQELVKRGYVLHIPYKKKKGEEDNKEDNKEEDNKRSDTKSQKTFCKTMGCRAYQLMAQQVQETVYWA